MQLVLVGFHNEVGEQFLASRVHLLAGLRLVGSLQGHADVATDTHILNAGEVEMFHVVDHRFTLRVEQFAVRHDVNFSNKFHAKSSCETRLRLGLGGKSESDAAAIPPLPCF